MRRCLLGKMGKGRMCYVPPCVFEELKCIKRNESIDKNTVAFGRLVDYARLGRGVVVPKRVKPKRVRKKSYGLLEGFL